MRRSIVGPCLWALLATGATPVFAEEGPRFEITPFGGARVGGRLGAGNTNGESRVDLESAASWGVELALAANPQGYYNVLYSTQRAGVDPAPPGMPGLEVRVDSLQIGGTALFPQEGGFVPYLSLALGATFLEATRGARDSETRLSGSLAGGFRFPVGDRLGVVLGVRGYVTLLDSDSRLFCASAPPESACLFEGSGSTLLQVEGLLGFSFAF